MSAILSAPPVAREEASIHGSARGGGMAERSGWRGGGMAERLPERALGTWLEREDDDLIALGSNLKGAEPENHFEYEMLM